MILRNLLEEVQQTAKEFKIICVTGPRQSGKTTLCRMAFPDKKYVTLEDPDVAYRALKNGRKFLYDLKDGAILDEIQRAPFLFSYLQGMADSRKETGRFILTGSNNFLMQSNVSQSLAGRAGYIELLPFSLAELSDSKSKYKRSLHDSILHGFYPDIVTGKITGQRWMPNYVKTYIERDIRWLKNIGNLTVFNRFIKLCAGRAAQLVNASELAKDTGVDVKTIQSWLAVLEASYITYLLPPYHYNFNKRLIKSPKMYFYDTGLLCHLLGINSISSLKQNRLYGAIFENFIVSEIRKNRYNKQQFGSMYFFRDSSGNELDVVIEKDGELLPVEIKSNTDPASAQIKNLLWWQKLSRKEGGILIHAGTQEKAYGRGIHQIGWKAVTEL